jgi:hypothetical protein
MKRRPFNTPFSNVRNLRPLNNSTPHDWMDDEPLTQFDMQLVYSVLNSHDIKAVREAGRRLEHHLRRTDTSPAGAGRLGVPRLPSGSQRPSVIDTDGGAA